MNGTIPFNLADFYKTGHPGMYPKETSFLVANFTPRSSKHAPVRCSPLFDDKVVWFGITGFIKEYLIETFNREFFHVPRAVAIRKYQRRMDTALGPGKVSMTHLERLHDLGYLPLELRSLPEGSRVNIKVPPVIFMNTHPEFAWVATYFETLFSCENWKPSTVATIAFEFRKLLTFFARQTGSPEDFVMWQGHDFSMRGLAGVKDAARSGAGHLLPFYGTDTIPAIDYLEDFYGADADVEIVGGSVPATEHSVMTLRILLITQRLQAMPEHANRTTAELRAMAEEQVIRELVTDDYPSGIVSIVADSFSFWNVITGIAPALKQEILARVPDALGNAKVVFRPDSGDPVKILTGYKVVEVFSAEDQGAMLAAEVQGAEAVFDRAQGKYFTFKSYDTGWTTEFELVELQACEVKGAVECLWDTFGGVMTDKGYKLLNPRVGLIYGDSITLERAIQILSRLKEKGFASGNVVFGIGSFTYQHITRDSFSWALKAIYADVGGDSVEIYKDPATDDGTKKSAKGLLRVEKEGNDFVLYEQQSREEFERGALRPIFRDGQLLVDEPLSVIRARLAASWVCPDTIPGA